MKMSKGTENYFESIQFLVINQEILYYAKL